MAKAATVTKAILAEILVRQSEAPLEPDEFQDTIFAMNNYMTALAATGVNLGYTVVSDLGDDITIAAGAMQGLVANVAIAVAPQFGMTATPELAEKARMGLLAMRKLGITREPTRHPSTLPIGSGNEHDFHHNHHHHFYPGLDEDIVSETGNSIGLESNT